MWHVMHVYFHFLFLKKKTKKQGRQLFHFIPVNQFDLKSSFNQLFYYKLTIDQMLDDIILSNKLSLQSVKHRDETCRGSKWFGAETSKKFSANCCTELID